MGREFRDALDLRAMKVIGFDAALGRHGAIHKPAEYLPRDAGDAS
jgi:hypothetical protein